MKGKILSAEEAVSFVRNGDTIGINASGGGVNEPTKLLKSLESRFLKTKEPRYLTIFHVCGIKGVDCLAHEDMVKRVIAGHWGWGPNLVKMVMENKIEGYNFPQGVLAQLVREIAGKRAGLLTKVGIGTFVDPRMQGGKLNNKTKEDLVRVMHIDGEEWLFYKTFPINVAFIRGTTADEVGNVTMEHEGVILEALSMAQAAKNQGGKVIVQVKRIARRGTLDPRLVKVPGILVDAIVVDKNQSQTLREPYNPAYSGEIKTFPIESEFVIPFNERKVIARRAALELTPYAVVNLGFGMPDGVAAVAREENIDSQITLTIEQGSIGGVPARGTDFGLSANPDAIIDEPSQFDFYDGGGIDIAFLSFAEVDKFGNVNVTKFGSRFVGCGGFINISQNAKKVVFCGTFTTKGLNVAFDNGQLRIVNEGKIKKFVPNVKQITFNGNDALRKKQSILYVTERAVFKLEEKGLELIEIAPGVDLKQNILNEMGFKPLISRSLKQMDDRVFLPQKMNLRLCKR